MSQYDSLSTLNDRLIQLAHGVYIGIVTNNNDPEKQGRVKVKIPVLDDEAESDWARVAVPSAGDKRGTQFIPDVGDEVLIAFLLGDLSQPVVIGSLWSKKKMPPDAGKKDIPYIIRSRSGHEIMLNDDDQDRKVMVKTAGGHQIVLSDKDKSLEIKDSGGQRVTMKNNAIEIVSGSTTVKIQGGNVTIESPSSLKIKGMQVTIQADAAMEIKANGNLKLTSNGLVELKGSLVKIN
jgi:uncharacterized protein involved in type VI secretion and phage assembly